MNFRSLAMAGAALLLATTSCVDDNYDLSDIDTSVRVEVKDLIIPVNVEDIELGAVLELEDDSPIKIIDGEYVIVEEGEFESSPINIVDFTLVGNTMESIEMTLPFVVIPGHEQYNGLYEIETHIGDFTYETNDVPEEIIEIEYVGGSLKMFVDFQLNGLEKAATGFSLNEIIIQLPKGLDMIDSAGGTYDPVSGLISLPDIHVKGNSIHIEVEAKGVNFEQADAIYDREQNYAIVKGQFYVVSGNLALTEEDILPGINPTEIHLYLGYGIPDYVIETFTGRIEYTIDDVEIDDISLSDIPGVLSQEDTDLIIANPQIYVSMNNPMQQYSLKAQTGLEITSYHKHEAPHVATLDNGYFVIDTKNAGNRYNYCLSPSVPENFYAGYDNPEHVPFTSLSYVLSGYEVPSKIGVRLDNPCIPDQRIENLRLGTNIEKVNGKYAFVAPIALLEGSKITYRDTVDDWYTEELKGLTINELTVHTTISTDLPIDLTMSVQPIDVKGNDIKVEVDPIHINAHAQQQDFKISIRGQIHDLDGLRFTAIAEDKEVITLSPDMKIRLGNLHVKATGYYDDEL